MLVAGNDKIAGKAVSDAFRINGYRPISDDGTQDPFTIRNDVDLAVIDIDGLSAGWPSRLLRLRRASSMPILIIGEEREELSVLLALRSGADDYIAKPLRPSELLARVEAISRRARGYRRDEPALTVDDISVDFDARVVHVGLTPIALTFTEFDVFAVLARNAGQAVSYWQIMSEVWGTPQFANRRTLRVHMHRIRAKIVKHDSLKTVRGYGYQFA